MRVPLHRPLALLGLICALIASAFAQTNDRGTFEVKDEQFMLNGRPFVYRAGEIHPPRVPKEYWRHRLRMLKAMGLNTVGVYLFWNQIEPRLGVFEWTGQADYPEFFRIAKEEGMWVIARPGPYVCAEWEGGGHPWWLGKDAPMEVRSRDPKYFEPAKRYLTEAARVIAPFQITQGGPVIIYQIENEYSKADQAYLTGLMKIATDNGITVPLMACNPPGFPPGEPGRRFKLNYRDDLFQTANFMRGSAKPAIDLLKQFKKNGPYACGEYYPGWFDYWGRKQSVGSLKSYLGDLSWMLENKVSFSIYMAHGGTNFGFWASGGPSTSMSAICTSYDYDAPLSEAGWVTDKFLKTRELLSRYLLPGETLPEIPAPFPVTTIAPFRLTEYVSVFEAGLPVGCQYASADYRALLAAHGCLASMSRRGNCYDNATMEAFWSTLKHELIYRRRFATRDEATTAIFDYVECFYNRTRLHSALGFKSPLAYESNLN